MSVFTLEESGWQPDLADPRDYSLRHEAVTRLLGKLRMHVRKQDLLPSCQDLREYCAPIADQQGLPTSSAHACVGLVQHLERRATGALLKPSRLFVHRSACRLQGTSERARVSLRTTLKAIVRCGLPPEIYWPYQAVRLDCEPDPFVYSFQTDYRTLRYVRLDAPDLRAAQVLQAVKSCLLAGLPAAFGFPVSSALGRQAEIPYPVQADGIVTGQAAVAVGYDDGLRIRSDKGALLVRNSWGADWGDGGYGWLPYRYVQERLAVDFWTLIKPSWLRSGEFELPR